MEHQVFTLHDIGVSFWLMKLPPGTLNNPNKARFGVIRAFRRMTKPFVPL